MEKLLQNKICVVTGAGRGIGRAIAEKYADEGAIVYAADIREEDLKWTENNKNVHGVSLDICDFSAVKNSVMAINKRKGWTW